MMSKYSIQCFPLHVGVLDQVVARRCIATAHVQHAIDATMPHALSWGQIPPQSRRGPSVPIAFTRQRFHDAPGTVCKLKTRHSTDALS